jgi:phage recombination protein Bet
MNGILQQPAPPFLSKEEETLLKRTILKNFPEDEQESFIRICQRTKLDPFVKQIYATKRYQKVREADGGTKKVPTLVPVTGIMGLTAVADRTGQYDGCEIFWCAADGEWRTEWLSEEHPAAAKCIVYHKHRRPEVGIARWWAYVGQQYDPEKRIWVIGDFWEKMDDYMLAKCAKAQALRGAFPDPLSNVFIREELESDITDTETEAIPSDEARVEEIQKREAEAIEHLKKSASSVKFVESRGPKPTPQEALEPAFEEDKIPEKPLPSPPRKAANIQNKPAAPVREPIAAQPPDDLDMGEEPAPPGPPAQQEPKTPPAGAGEVAAPWKDHVILGVNHVKFHKRKVGELNAAELAIIEGQWLPAVREQWEDATDAQRADASAFEAAIAHSKMVKPW